MSEERKERTDIRLRKLPQKKQDEIIDYMETVSVAEVVKRTNKQGVVTEDFRFRCPRLREVVEWLKKDGIEVASPTISQFRGWYKIKQQLAANEASTQALHKGKKPRTAAEERERAQQFFNQLAIDHRDVKGWSMAQRVDIARGYLDLQRDRFNFNASEAIVKNFATVRDIIEDPTLDHKARIDAVRLALFGPLSENESQNPPTEKSAAL